MSRNAVQVVTRRFQLQYIHLHIVTECAHLNAGAVAGIYRY